MSGQQDDKRPVSGDDDYDLSLEKLLAPELNNRWLPEPVPTEAPHRTPRHPHRSRGASA